MASIRARFVTELPGPKSREWLRPPGDGATTLFFDDSTSDPTLTAADGASPLSGLGMVSINTRIPLVNEAPHGGYKQSGYGEYMEIYSLAECTQIKRVMAAHD